MSPCSKTSLSRNSLSSPWEKHRLEPQNIHSRCIPHFDWCKGRLWQLPDIQGHTEHSHQRQSFEVELRSQGSHLLPWVQHKLWCCTSSHSECTSRLFSSKQLLLGSPHSHVHMWQQHQRFVRQCSARSRHSLRSWAKHIQSSWSNQ